MSFTDTILKAAAERGAAGGKRLLTELALQAGAENYSMPNPRELVATLPTRKNGETETEPLVFVYALYLMVTYGYDAVDATRIADNFRTELDGFMVENIVLTRSAIADAEIERSRSLKDTALERKIEALSSSAKRFRKMVADGRALTPEQEVEVANIVGDLQSLITHKAETLV